MTTDSLSRAKFRRYRSYVSPGILLIRVAMQGGSTISSLNSLRSVSKSLTRASKRS